jgi:ATP-dependent metalloprotease FtsH
MNWFSSPPEPKNDNGLLILIIFILFIYTANKQGWGKKDKKEKEKKEDSLSKIIGLESVKDEIRYYMDFIKNKDKYIEWDVKLPKGILLAGPPGTGKTLLVKTLSKKLDIPLITASGSEFIEMYVGVGAKRVRELFAKAKGKKNCIIFIDEIDAVGTKRELGNNSERASTVNQLLTEMDGFEEKNNIMVFAATNLIKFLDPALTRSGRFDKKVYFDLPNNDERKQLCELYLKNIQLPRRISYTVMAERTAGLSGADIANIANQAKILAIQNNNEKNTLKEIDIQSAIDEVMIGREKRERMMTTEERERVSYHEAGHCLMGFLLKHTEQPVKVSIIPRGEAALGYSQQKSNNKKLMTKDEVLCRISVLLGGRSAEKLIYGNVSTGASDDIEKISILITRYTNSWGMNNTIGPLNPEVMGSIGKQLTSDIMVRCKDIIEAIEKQTIKLLKKNKKYVELLAKNLLLNETINYEKIKSLIPSKFENSQEITLDTLR